MEKNEPESDQASDTTSFQEIWKMEETVNVEMKSKIYKIRLEELPVFSKELNILKKKKKGGRARVKKHLTDTTVNAVSGL